MRGINTKDSTDGANTAEDPRTVIVSGATGTGKSDRLRKFYAGDEPTIESAIEPEKIFCRNCRKQTRIIENHCSGCREMICERCGCTDSAACDVICSWLEPGLCDACGEDF